ncbi:MAG: SatD family protein [Bacteroidota bacterium]
MSRTKNQSRVQSQAQDQAQASPSLWLVVTADVVRSRRLAPRAQAQERIQKALAALNQSPLFGVDRQFLAAAFTLGRGDEIQGVLTATAPLLPILRHLRHALQPARLRIGIGLGEIETPTNPDSSWQMDGPAFRLAREALEGLGHTVLPRTRLRLGLGSGFGHGPDAEEVHRHAERRFNTLLSLYDEIMRHWTQRQWEAVAVLEEAGTLRAAADKLGIAPQNVHKRVQAAGWGSIQEAEKLVTGELNMLLRTCYR